MNLFVSLVHQWLIRHFGKIGTTKVTKKTRKGNHAQFIEKPSLLDLFVDFVVNTALQKAATTKVTKTHERGKLQLTRGALILEFVRAIS